MPIYKYQCDSCGFEQEQFLRADKDSVQITCKRCLKQTIAKQVRDKSLEYHEQGYVQGTTKHEEAGV